MFRPPCPLGRPPRFTKKLVCVRGTVTLSLQARNRVITHPQVRFEERGPELMAVEIGQRSCSPLIGLVHHAMFALGLDVSSYRARPEEGGLVEQLVLERPGGGRIDSALSAQARAAILPIALGGVGLNE